MTFHFHSINHSFGNDPYEAYYKTFSAALLILFAAIGVRKLIRRNGKSAYRINKKYRMGNRAIRNADNRGKTYEPTPGAIRQRTVSDKPLPPDPVIKGKIGEYLVYDALSRMPGEKRMLHSKTAAISII